VGFDQIMAQGGARRGERGRSFSGKILAVFARIDAAIAMPPSGLGSSVGAPSTADPLTDPLVAVLANEGL
jgi:hypothetical protein